MRVLFLLITICYTNFFIGQTPELTFEWGPSEESPKNSFHKVIAGDTDGFVTIFVEKYGNKKKSLQRFDSDMNLTKTIPLDLKYDSKQTQLEFQHAYRGYLYLFFEGKDSKTQEDLLLVKKIKTSTLQIENEFEIVGRSKKNELRNRLQRGFEIAFSPDSTLFSIETEIFSSDEKTQRQIEVFDLNFETKYSTIVSFDKYREAIITSNHTLQNNGVSYFTTQEKLNYKIMAFTHDGSENFVYQVKPDINEIKKVQMDADCEKLLDLDIHVDSKENIVVSGFSGRGIFAYPATIYYLKINPEFNGKISEEAVEFDQRLIYGNYEKYEKKVAVKAVNSGKRLFLPNCDLLKTYRSTDDSYSLIYQAEIPEGYGSGDIFILKFTANEIEGISKISKHQKFLTIGFLYADFVVSQIQNQLVFLFNDAPGNLSIRDAIRPATLKESTLKNLNLTLVVLNDDGSYSKKALDTQENHSFHLSFSHALQYQDNKFIFYCKNGSKHKFLSLTLN